MASARPSGSSACADVPRGGGGCRPPRVIAWRSSAEAGEEIALDAGCAGVPAHEPEALPPEYLVEERRRHPGEEDLRPHLGSMRHEGLALALDVGGDVDLSRDQLVGDPDLRAVSLTAFEGRLDAGLPQEATE